MSDSWPWKVRWSGVLAAATIVALSATCGSAETAAPSRAFYAAAPCPNPIAAGVPQYDLGPEFECGYLTVLENRSRPDGRTIKLPVARRKATSPNPNPAPVVYLAGGPGGTPWINRASLQWPLDRDVIYLGQRGTLKADPFLSCSEFDQFYAEAVSLSWEDPATAEKSDAAVRACRDRLASAGIDLAAYNTTESAADVADLRVALGIKDWNIYGLSYGTDLALQTLRNHPEGIRALVLDSVLPPQVNLVEQGWASAASSYKAIFDGCAADAACASAFPDLRSEFIKLVNDLSAKPRTVAIVDAATGKKTDVVIDGYKLASGVVVSASQTHGDLEKIPAIIDNLANGDGTQAAKYLAADVTPPNFVGYGLQFSTECSELVAHADLERVKAVGKSALPDFPDAVLSLPAQVGFIFGNCEQWAVPPAAQGVSAPVTSDVPMLLVSGSFDSATPPSYADEAAKTLPNSRYFMFQGVGHGVAEYSPVDAKCFVEIMQSFLDRPTVFDDTCFKSLRIAPFETP